MVKKTPKRTPPSRTRAASVTVKPIHAILVSALAKHLESLSLSDVEIVFRVLLEGVVTHRPGKITTTSELGKLRSTLNHKRK